MTLKDNENQLPTSDTEPSTSYVMSRHNAARHGILSRYVVLPWENRADYDGLHRDLVVEHGPAGPTEAHLVEELAGIIWRKRRVRMAETALHHATLSRASEASTRTVRAALVISTSEPSKVEVRDALTFEPETLPAELADLERDEAATRAAIGGLEECDASTYQSALSTLYDSTRDAWSDQLTWEDADYSEGMQPYRPDTKSLKRYLEDEILPWYDRERERLLALPAVRAQALGESLDPEKLDRLSRYEVHLDRKFERTLSTLLRLQDIRRARATAD
jgi:hypothetical protein